MNFLEGQGVAFHGHEDTESNFMQFKLQELDNPVPSAWLKRSGDKYLSPEMMMSLSALLSIAKKLQSSNAFSIMADECQTTSN